MSAPTVTLPLLDERLYASPVSIAVTSGVWTARRLPIPKVCECTDDTCLRCFLDDDIRYERSLDV